MNSGLILSILSILFWALSFLYFRSYLARKTGPQRILSDFRDEVDKLIAEIDAATDRDSSLIEDRIKALRTLLDEADRRIASYSREVERRSSEERAYAELGRYRGRSTTPGPGPMTTPKPTTVEKPDTEPSISSPTPSVSSPETVGAPVPPRAPTATPRPFTEPSHLTEGAPTPSDISTAAGEGMENSSPKEGKKPVSGPRFIRSTAPVEPKAASFAERVAELSRAGFSADLIAKRLGATVAEVDLAIALAGRLDERYVDDTGN